MAAGRWLACLVPWEARPGTQPNSMLHPTPHPPPTISWPARRRFFFFFPYVMFLKSYFLFLHAPSTSLPFLGKVTQVRFRRNHLIKSETCQVSQQVHLPGEACAGAELTGLDFLGAWAPSGAGVESGKGCSKKLALRLVMHTPRWERGEIRAGNDLTSVGTCRHPEGWTDCGKWQVMW